MHVQKLYCEIEDYSFQRRHEVDMVLTQILCDIVQYIPRIVFASRRCPSSVNSCRQHEGVGWLLEMVNMPEGKR